MGKVGIGGNHPISVQSMTNTPTHNVKATLHQIEKLKKNGCEIVRLAVPDEKSAKAIVEIRRSTDIPLIADIHFDYRLALKALETGINGLRINPGNIGKKKDVEAVVKSALERNVPIRIGVNAGSLEKDVLTKFGHPTPEAMVESALKHIRILEKLNFDKIKVSLKSSNALDTINAYRLLAKKCDYPFHLGITEAGTVFSGSILSAVALGILLHEGIGDTIRVSLSGPPEEEVRVGWEILKALELRSRRVKIISCPTCARKQFDVAKVAATLEEKLAYVTAPITIAVMGCVVNGPGEARLADIGVAGGKSGKSALYIKGRIKSRIDNNSIVSVILEEIQSLISTKKAEDFIT